MLAHIPYTRVVIYAYKYADTNNEHAVVSQLSLVGGATHPELNQRNVLSEALAAPTLVRGNRRADTRAHTALGPYFSHKLMFCLLRMHNCASRATRFSSPSASLPFSVSTQTGRRTVRDDTADTSLISMAMTCNEGSNGYRDREYTRCTPYTRH